jgi:hypothetical protein
MSMPGQEGGPRKTEGASRPKRNGPMRICSPGVYP